MVRSAILLSRAAPSRAVGLSTVIGGVLLGAAILRFYMLGAVSLWTDEQFTAIYPRLGLGYLWTEGLRIEPTPPLYYSLIWLVERVAGEGAFALRLPSVAGSLLTIWLAALLARELFGRASPAIVAALLLALSPTSIFFAQEARTYALQGAAVALALLGFAWFLRQRNHAVPLALYASGAVLALYLHPTSAVAVAAINLAALSACVGRTRLLDRPALFRWCAVNAAVALLCLPLAPAMLSSQGAAAVAWIPPLSRWSLESLIGTVLAGPAIGEHAMLLAEVALPLLAALLLLPRWRPGRRASTVLLLVPAVFLALMIGISVARPVLLTRTLAWTLVPLAIVLGDVLTRRPRVIVLGFTGALLASTLLHLSSAEVLKENWQGFLVRLPKFSPASLIVLAPHTSPAALALYAPDAGAPVQIKDAGPPVAETIVADRVFSTPSLSQAELQATIAAGRPVWLIYRRPEYRWMLQTTAGLPAPTLTVQDVDGSNPAMRALFWGTPSQL